jgi:hypothetical protein
VSKEIIKLSQQELQSKLSRVKWAEGLILQLPNTHDGRNSWLLNYGVSKEAMELRAGDAQRLRDMGYEPRQLTWNDETQCLNSAS